jgi:hypothetical protein
MLLWGGAGLATYHDGFAYHPDTDTWKPMAAVGLAGRIWPLSAWTGTSLIVWGGDNNLSTAFGDGAVYHP